MAKIIAIPTFALALALAAPALSQDEAPVDTAPASAAPTEPVLQDNVPDRYIVKSGDTLWDISARYLKNPWKWPDLWGINRDHIRNPHWIYPGDVLVLDLTGRTPRLRLEGEPDGGRSRWYGYELQTTKLAPQMRKSSLSAAPIPTISPKEIAPFLMRPLIVDPSQVAAAPKIIAADDLRVAVSAGDRIYVTGVDQNAGARYQIYRKGRVFQDPDTREVLGHEALYVGDASVTGFGEISSALIASANQEVVMGDRLTIAPSLQHVPYQPHAPEGRVRGRVIAGGDHTVSELGTYSVIITNRGAREGIEVGHVLGLYRSEGQIPVAAGKAIPLPEQRYGIALVFRVFERLSYALVMGSSRPVNVGDAIGNP
jgi:hypothetical protein